MKTKLILSTLLIACLSYSGLANATADKSGAIPAKANSDKPLTREQKSTAHQAIGEAIKQQKALKESINKNVLDGFKEVTRAISLLEKKDQQKQALKALEVASGKFDIALAAEPELGLVAIDSTVQMYELLSTRKDIEAAKDQAIKLLRDNQLQAARALLTPLRDEIVNSTTYLPMATYPDSIKLAARAMVENKVDKARQILAQGLSTFVVKDSVIPLPLLRAEAFLNQASKLDRAKDKQKIISLLNVAEEQVSIDKELGYADEHSAPYDALASQIKSLRWAIKGPNAVERLYSEVKKSFKDLIHKEARQQAAKPAK